MRSRMSAGPPAPPVLRTAGHPRAPSLPAQLRGNGDRLGGSNLGASPLAATIVFIESNTSGTGRLFARAARARGLRPLMICADPARYPYLAEDAVDHMLVDTADRESVSAACRAVAAEAPLAAITSSSEYWIGAAARMAADMGLRGPSADAIELCRNKYRQRRRLVDAGIRVPACWAVADGAQAAEAGAALELPVVVKPVAGSGSVGVRLCRDFDEIVRHAQALADAAPPDLATPPVLVERFVDAPEFSVETFAGAVVGVTCKHLSQPPLFVETGHDYPATIEPASRRMVEDAALRTLDVLDLSWGATHIELRLTPEGPVIIEVNPRLAGGFIPELVRLACGVDLIDATIRRLVGQPIDLAPTRRSHASIRFLQPAMAGVLTAVEGMDEALSIAGVQEVVLYRRVGEAVALHGDFRDRIGHVIACGGREHAAAAAEHARDVISITVKAG